MIKLITSVKSIWKGKLISEIPYDIIMPHEFLPNLGQSLNTLTSAESTTNDVKCFIEIKAKVCMKLYSHDRDKMSNVQTQQCDETRQDEESKPDDRSQKIGTNSNTVKKRVKSKQPIGEFRIDFDIWNGDYRNLEVFHQAKGQERSLCTETIAFQRMFEKSEIICECDGTNDWKWISKYIPTKFRMLICVHQDIFYEDSYVAFFVTMETRLKPFDNQILYPDHCNSTHVQFVKKDKYMTLHDTHKYSGNTLPLNVTEYALVIEERFIDNPYVCRLPDHGPMTFAWYSKCGGENAGLDVTIHIKNAKGKIHNCFKYPVELKTELIYSDGSNAPLMPNSPLKERRNTKCSKIPLFHPLRPSPIFPTEVGSQTFSFRIEEVSIHHPGQTGFKLKVSIANMDSLSTWISDDSCIDFHVHPGILDEIIIVRSKPKLDNDGMKKVRLHGGRSPRRRESFLKRLNKNHSRKRSCLPTITSLGNAQHETSALTHYPFGSYVPASTCFENEMDSNCFSISWNLFINDFIRTNDQKCLWCGVQMSSTPYAIDSNTHMSKCYFASVLLPFIRPLSTNAYVSSNDKENYGDENKLKYCSIHSHPHDNHYPNKLIGGHIFDDFGNFIPFPDKVYSGESIASKNSLNHSRNRVSILGFTDESIDLDFMEEMNLNALDLYDADADADANVDDGAHLVTVFEDDRGK